jgi:SAM-dependent methyltransferase
MEIVSTTAEPLAQGVLPQPALAHTPELIPPPDLMNDEGIDVMEDWFRWADEWSVFLRIYGGLTLTSAVLEIGCGLGRIAYPLRYYLADGSYDGFEICQRKIAFLERTFHPAQPNFRFVWANVHNTFYNPEGQTPAAEYRFPYPANSFDLVYAASVFTHMLPEAAGNYFREAARVLKPRGRCVFSFFLLDHYRPGEPRPSDFGRESFAFEHRYGDYDDDFAIAVPNNPEQMTAYRLKLIESFAVHAGLEFAQAPVPGLWSGTVANWICAQDLVVLRKASQASI